MRSGGAVVRGQRVKKDSTIWHQLRQKGYSKKELTDYVVPLKGGKARKPLDWFDSVLKARIEELSDIAADYYGDNTLEQLKR